MNGDAFYLKLLKFKY